MTSDPSSGIRLAEVVLPAGELDETVAFFVDRLGFRIASIIPADDPRVAVLAGHGVRLRLDREYGGDPGALRLSCDEPAAVAGGAREVVAPNGTRVALIDADPPLDLPPWKPSLVVSRLADARWHGGRAGMEYRDLVPDRQGGRLVASHLRIPGGGPVPDYVHWHRIEVQLIYCFRGWVRVVYEDQGPPFVLQAGDCVLQPPRIRHRVLESSPGLEVVELGCPAEHETHADPELALPTATLRPERSFEGQRFVRHEAARARWVPWRRPGFEARDLGIAAATGGLAGVQVVRATGASVTEPHRHAADLVLGFVLEGGVSLHVEDRAPEALRVGDAFVVPPGPVHFLADASADLELLVVTRPATFATTPAG